MKNTFLDIVNPYNMVRYLWNMDISTEKIFSNFENRLHYFVSNPTQARVFPRT